MKAIRIHNYGGLELLKYEDAPRPEPTSRCRSRIGSRVEAEVASSHSSDATMNTTRSSLLVPEVPGYTELQRKMQDALRAQHPEWIEAEDGKSPTCDYYESLFAALLVTHRAHARVHYAHLLNITKTERHTANSSMPVGYAEARNIIVVPCTSKGLKFEQ